MELHSTKILFPFTTIAEERLATMEHVVQPFSYEFARTAHGLNTSTFRNMDPPVIRLPAEAADGSFNKDVNDFDISKLPTLRVCLDLLDLSLSIIDVPHWQHLIHYPPLLCLLFGMLTLDPAKRLTAREATQHQYFASFHVSF